VFSPLDSQGPGQRNQPKVSRFQGSAAALVVRLAALGELNGLLGADLLNQLVGRAFESQCTNGGLIFTCCQKVFQIIRWSIFCIEAEQTSVLLVTGYLAAATPNDRH